MSGTIPAPILHVVSAEQFTREWLDQLFQLARQMEEQLAGAPERPLSDRIMATLFYEPSTRTRLSFEAAMLRLGGQVISTENATDFSSAVKGETLEDTVRIVGGYADCIVLRHREEGAAARAAAISPVPVINAGDGPGQHPTQALLDLYTIERELGHIDGLRVAMVGDLTHGRTVHSLAQLLCLYQRVKVTLAAPDRLRMRPELVERMRVAGIEVRETSSLVEAVRDADVVYQTRVQLERFSEPWADAREQTERFRIGTAVLEQLPQQAIVMHPLPRVGELDPDVDSDPRASYFRQARNGVPIRMALLRTVLRA